MSKRFTIPKIDNKEWEKAKEAIPAINASGISLPLGVSIFLGPSMSGKNWLTQRILEKTHREYEVFCLFTRNHQGKGQWERFFDSIGRKLVICSESKLPAIVKRIASRPKNGKKALIVLDDISGSVEEGGRKYMKHDVAFSFLAANSRHGHISTIMLVQDPSLVTPLVISNAFLIVCFRFFDYQRREALFERCLFRCLWQFKFLRTATKRKRYDFFHEVMDDKLEKHQALLMHKNEKDANYKLFRIKAHI